MPKIIGFYTDKSKRIRPITTAKSKFKIKFKPSARSNQDLGNLAVYPSEENKARLMRKALRYAESEMGEGEKHYVLSNISAVAFDEAYGDMPIATSFKTNGKVFVTIDFGRLAELAALTSRWGGRYEERLGILTAYHLIHEAAHNEKPSEEYALKKSLEFLEKRKDTFFINNLKEATKRKISVD